MVILKDAEKVAAVSRAADTDDDGRVSYTEQHAWNELATRDPQKQQSLTNQELASGSREVPDIVGNSVIVEYPSQQTSYYDAEIARKAAEEQSGVSGMDYYSDASGYTHNNNPYDQQWDALDLDNDPLR